MNFFYTLFLVALSATPFLPTITAHCNKDYLASQTSFLRLLQKSAIPAYSESNSIPTNMVYSPYGVDISMCHLVDVLTDVGRNALSALYRRKERNLSCRIPLSNPLFTASIPKTVLLLPPVAQAEKNLRAKTSDYLPTETNTDEDFSGTSDSFSKRHVSGLFTIFLKFGKEQVLEPAVNNWINRTTHGMILGNEKLDDKNGTLSLISSAYFALFWKYPMIMKVEDFKTVDKHMNHIVQNTVKYATYFGTFYGAKLWKSEKDNVQILSLPYADHRFSLSFIYPSDGDVPKFLKNLEEDKIDIEGIKSGDFIKHSYHCNHDIKFPMIQLKGDASIHKVFDIFGFTDVFSNCLVPGTTEGATQVYYKQKTMIAFDETAGNSSRYEITSGSLKCSDSMLTAHVDTAFMFRVEYTERMDSVILYQGIITDIIDAQKDMWN